MLPPHIQERVQLFITLLQALRSEGCELEKIRESFYDYGMNEKDFEDLWRFYLQLETQWMKGVQMFLERGKLDEESKCMLEGISEPFFEFLCKRQTQTKTLGIWGRLFHLFRSFV